MLKLNKNNSVQDFLPYETILENGIIYPIEIKKNTSPGNSALKNFNVLSTFQETAGDGAVICLSPMVCPLDARNKIVPVGVI